MKLLSIIWLLTATVFAQGPAENLFERLARMSPEERRKVLDRMPPARRQQLLKRLDRFSNAPPRVRERVRRDYEQFQQLSPEKQKEVRETLRRIADLPQDRQRMVRGAIAALRRQPEQARQRRMSSKAFNDRFQQDERQLIQDAIANLPPPDPKLDSPQN